jgi:hypothetical protein
MAVECDGACVNPAADPLHCGGCHVVCGAGQACNDGACTQPTGPDHCVTLAICCSSTQCADAVATGVQSDCASLNLSECM